jgi:uncharacterized damage-inducible protein DinB
MKFPKGEYSVSQTDQMIALFKSHRDVTNALIGKIKPEQEAYQPTPTSMSAKQLAVHILTATYKFVRVASNGNPSLFKEKTEVPQASLQELAESLTERTLALIQGMTDEDWERELDVADILGKKMKASAFFRLGIDHEIHHKGQLFVYVREMGYTDLPFYTKK